MSANSTVNLLKFHNIVKCIKTRCSISQIASMIIQYLHYVLNPQNSIIAILRIPAEYTQAIEPLC